MEYRHNADYEVKYTDADFKDELKLSSLLEFLEQSACLSADELGFGYGVLQPKNIGFILVNWYVELFRPVRIGETLTVSTWPVKPKMFVVMRDFELFVGNDKVGVATSRWCLVNLDDFSMLPASAALSKDTAYNEFRAVEVKNFKIPSLAAVEPVYSKKVTYSDYDHYNHVNNTKYADFLLDVFSVDEMRGKSIKSVKITYVKQSKFGEVLQFSRLRQSDGSWIVEARCEGNLHTQLQVLFDD